VFGIILLGNASDFREILLTVAAERVLRYVGVIEINPFVIST